MIVQRTDLELGTDKAASELEIADNRVAQVGLQWDTDVLSQQMQDNGIEIKDMFTTQELGDMTKATEIRKSKQAAEEDGGAGFSQTQVKVKVFYFKIEDWLNWKNRIVNFLNENQINYEVEE